jgi:hypothetical protein
MARLIINHPLPGETVASQFIAAQGDGDPTIRNVIGIIWDPLATVVAVGMAIRNPPHWIIGFYDIPPGNGYCLEVIDANTKERLACSGPFDAVDTPPAHGPTVYYPTTGATVSANFSAYGYWAGVNPLEGQVQEPSGPSGWQPQVKGPPGTPNWIISFTSLKPDHTGGSSFTVRDTVVHATSTTVGGLSVS